MYKNERKYEGTEKLIQTAEQVIRAGRPVKLRLAGPAGKFCRWITNRFFTRSGGFGMNELLGIAAALIIAAFVVIPGLRKLAESLIEKLVGWWDSTISGQIFPSS